MTRAHASSSRRALAGGVVWALAASLCVIAASAVSPPPASASPTDYPATVLADNPLGYWRLDDPACSTAPCPLEDHVGTSDGSANEDVQLGRGSLVRGTGGSAEFDTVGGLAAPAAILPGTDDLYCPSEFTVELWIYQTRQVDGLWIPVVSTDFWSVLVAGPMTFAPPGPDAPYSVAFRTADPEADPSNPFPLRSWGAAVADHGLANRAPYHIVAQRETDGDVVLFINGTQAATEIAITTGRTFCQDIVLEGDAVLSEVAFYDYLLSPSQIESHYLAGEGANPVLLQGGPLTPAETRAGGSPSQRCCVRQHTDYPVALPSGEFWHRFTSFSFPGRGVPMRLDHSYSSTAADIAGPLGFGWAWSYGMHLAEDAASGRVTVHEEGGTAVSFKADPFDPGEYVPTVPRTKATLEPNDDGSWTFTRQRVKRYEFGPSGRLAEIGSLIGDSTATIALVYDSAGQLTTVTDAVGRVLTFTWAGSRIVGVHDSSTPSRSVTFVYDGNGDLIEWVDVAGGSWGFTYDSNHRMVTMREPQQEGEMPPAVITNVYDPKGRVISQTDQLGHETTFDYLPGQVRTTDPEGGSAATLVDGGCD